MNKAKGEAIEAPYSEIDLAATQFDHPEWTRAQPIQIARYWSGEEAPASRHAEARIIWSDDSLVVRFVCNQREPLLVSSNPQLTQKTIGLWDRDVCEIFIAPDASNPNRYFEFEAAPTGEWVDLAINLGPNERETDPQFHSGMTTAAQIADSQLTITMRIPWSDAVRKPKPRDEWRVNLFRCIGTGYQRYLAWQPTHTPEPDFHVPSAFGWLSFVRNLT
jgi:hypothetical protein